MKNKIFAVLCAVVLVLTGCSTKGAPPAQGQADPSSNGIPRNQCQVTEVLYQGTCYAQYLPCTASGGLGQQEFFNGAYGACQLNSCPSGNHVENNVCVSNIRACAIANGTGEQQWSGSGYGACVRKTCNADYRADGNACIGPIANLHRHRFQPVAGGIFGHYFSLNAAEPDMTPQGVHLILFKTAQATAGVALLQCSITRFSAKPIHYANTQCENGADVTITLGYMSATPLANGMNKAIYYCQMSAASYGITTTNQAEAAGICGANAAVIGYSF